MDRGPPGSSVHGISQARILQWVAISFSGGSSQPRGQTHVSCTAGRSFTSELPGMPMSGLFTFWKKKSLCSCYSCALITCLLCSSEMGILTSTALLHRIVRQVTSDILLQEMVFFILGEQREPETLAEISRHPLRHRLIEHCDHISDEVSYTRI